MEYTNIHKIVHTDFNMSHSNLSKKQREIVSYDSKAERMQAMQRNGSNMTIKKRVVPSVSSNARQGAYTGQNLPIFSPKSVNASN